MMRSIRNLFLFSSALMVINPLQSFAQTAPAQTAPAQTAPAQTAPAQTAPAQHKWAVVVHGGAGVIERSSMTPEAEAQYRAGITEAMNAAAQVLDKGGSSIDAVEAAIKLLEDNPMFNAGHGAVFAADGTNQL